MFVELKFVNEDASPKELDIKVEYKSVQDVIDLYSYKYEGDNYKVFADGVEVSK